jgi:peptidoglycan/xylan/chitin deacetylase (PgdA/CDA1 family)
MTKIIGLNVHVDTFEGMRHGVVRLLELFEKYGISTTFFVPMGKDHTGWTVLRAFKHPGLVLKAKRGNAVGAYGVKTLMRGILLPGPEIARKNTGILHAILNQGHELGIHGLDHVYWHDHIRNLNYDRTQKILDTAFSTYTELMGTKPRSFAAPGWMINAHAFDIFCQSGLAYSTDTRGTEPFYPHMGGRSYPILQIPLTLPTLDEMVGLVSTDQSSLAHYFADQLTCGLNVFAVHTEFEGNKWVQFLETFIELSLDRGYRFLRLADIADNVKNNSPDLPVCQCLYSSIQGRAADVTVQGPAIEA